MLVTEAHNFHGQAWECICSVAIETMRLRVRSSYWDYALFILYQKEGMKVKKALSLILAIVLCVGLCACVSNSETNAVSEPVKETVFQENTAVDIASEKTDTNRRSEQVQNIIDRLNNGGEQIPSIEEIMAIPEIAAAERANEGTETINLPDREEIRKAGYEKAIQKGSWNGTDFSGEVQQNRRIDIVIGLPGSGKSSVYTERLSQEHKSRVMDTDDFREYIPEYNGSNAAIVHKESEMIRDLVFETALDNGDNILLSTIGADAKKLEKQITAYKEEGYQVYLHLNELPNNKSLARAIGRYIGEDGTLGRYVSPLLIAGYGDKPTQTYLYLTGQGGKNDGQLDGDLQVGGGSASGDAAETGRAPQGTEGAAVPADFLAGYDWYNNDVKQGEPPRLIQTSDESASAADTQ